MSASTIILTSGVMLHVKGSPEQVHSRLKSGPHATTYPEYSPGANGQDREIYSWTEPDFVTFESAGDKRHEIRVDSVAVDAIVSKGAV